MTRVRAGLARFFFALTLTAGCIVLGSPAAQAYQSARIGEAGAKLYSKPNANAKVKNSLAAGAMVNLNDHPSNGFYRCTAPDGTTGWVKASDVNLPAGKKAIEGKIAVRPSTPIATTPASPSAPAAAASPPTPAATPSPPPASALEGTKNPNFHVGVFGGFGIYAGDPGMTFALDVGYKVLPTVGLGFYFNYATISSSVTTGTTTTQAIGGSSLIVYAGELDYYFQGLGSGAYVGVRGGVAMASAAAAGITVPAAASGTISAFAFGPTAGYDYMITHFFSLGLQANLFVVTYSSGTTTFFDGMGAFKFYF